MINVLLCLRSLKLLIVGILVHHCSTVTSCLDCRVFYCIVVVLSYCAYLYRRVVCDIDSSSFRCLGVRCFVL